VPRRDAGRTVGVGRMAVSAPWPDAGGADGVRLSLGVPTVWLHPTSIYITFRHVMAGKTATAARASSLPSPAGVGRPRDSRIDDSVLVATTELLEEVGYLRLTVGAIAERAGTNKPAIYRRWPTKAHLVHEAVFPVDGRAEEISPGGDLRSDIRALVAIGLELLGRPAARAALPGLMAEITGDSTLQTDVLSRFATGTWGWLQQRIDAAIDAGEVRADVQSSTVLELIAGATLVATAIRPREELGAEWVGRVVDVIVGGIT
jgi:AcrR family transcriptional regulator